MYVHVKRIEIIPQLARQFFKRTQSSSKEANDTLLFWIDKNDDNEKTGNISVSIELAAFNNDYARYTSFKPAIRLKSWRWRT